MSSDHRAPLTPSQAASFKKLRVLIFSVFLVLFAFILWQATFSGGQISKFVESTTMSSAGRASVLALSVVAGLVFGWVACNNIAKILAKQVS